MSEFELFEALIMSVEVYVLASMNFLAILVAYIVAAYVAGKDIPTPVAVGTSLVYTMFLIPPLSGVIGNVSRTYDLGSHLQAQFPDSPLAAGAGVPLEITLSLFCIPMIASWLGSLYFMHLYIRREATSDN